MNGTGRLAKLRAKKKQPDNIKTNDSLMVMLRDVLCVVAQKLCHNSNFITFRYSTIFCKIGVYRGRIFSVKSFRSKYVDITRKMKMELKALKDLR